MRRLCLWWREKPRHYRLYGQSYLLHKYFFGFLPPRNESNQTNQLHQGSVSRHDGIGKNSIISYRVDTQGGNSGSPIVTAANPNDVVGIHTHAGCEAGVAGSNSGASFGNISLWNASHWDTLASDSPAWSDQQGWDDVANYSTIQALDVGGVLHLVGRANTGMAVFR